MGSQPLGARKEEGHRLPVLSWEGNGGTQELPAIQRGDTRGEVAVRCRDVKGGFVRTFSEFQVLERSLSFRSS